MTYITSNKSLIVEVVVLNDMSHNLIFLFFIFQEKYTTTGTAHD